jgi:hypothetical protein
MGLRLWLPRAGLFLLSIWVSRLSGFSVLWLSVLRRRVGRTSRLAGPGLAPRGVGLASRLASPQLARRGLAPRRSASGGPGSHRERECGSGRWRRRSRRRGRRCLSKLAHAKFPLVSIEVRESEQARNPDQPIKAELKAKRPPAEGRASGENCGEPTGDYGGRLD